MRVWVICHLLAAFFWGSTSAQDIVNIQEISPQEPTRNKTEAPNVDPESGVSKKFFLPIIEDDNDDFYPKPHLPHLFHHVHHHKPDYHKPVYHYPEHHEPDYDHKPEYHYPEHHEKPKPPVHKPPPIHIHKPPPIHIHKPPPVHIHKPEIHKPPIVIHHKPVHKPVHIHIHKPSPHAFKPHITVHHGDYDKPEHLKPEHHKPSGYHKEDCDNCTGIKLEDGLETIDLSQAVLHEVTAAGEDDTKYSTDQGYIYSQLEELPENYEKYDVNYPPMYFEEPSKPPQNDNSPSASGIRKPVVSLSDFLTDMGPLPSYSHQEKEPVRKLPVGNTPQQSGSEKTHDHDRCQVHHHYHYYEVKHPEYSHHPHHPHPPHPPYHPPKPHVPSYYPLVAQREDSSTESSVAEVVTVDPAITIPYNEYDVTKATTETVTKEVTKGAEEVTKAVEQESQSQKKVRKPQSKPSIMPLSHMLLWPFTPKPSAKAARKPHRPEQDTSNEKPVQNNDGQEDNFFPDFFELK